ncbi:MAG: hypothetical protein P8Y93_06390 [Acidobacteriota bacterium]
MFYTLFDYLTHTKGVTYVFVGIFLLLFLSFWRFLTERESDR